MYHPSPMQLNFSWLFEPLAVVGKPTTVIIWINIHAYHINKVCRKTERRRKMTFLLFKSLYSNKRDWLLNNWVCTHTHLYKGIYIYTHTHSHTYISTCVCMCVEILVCGSSLWCSHLLFSHKSWWRAMRSSSEAKRVKRPELVSSGDYNKTPLTRWLKQ